MPRRRIQPGQWILTTIAVTGREAFYLREGKSGTVRVDIPAGLRLQAFTTEAGGNVFVRTRASDDEEVIVGLAEGEWRAAS